MIITVGPAINAKNMMDKKIEIMLLVIQLLIFSRDANIECFTILFVKYFLKPCKHV
tara:strand:+ start:41762 stop:41929 length:168 start_codon:yes stop_codon:yes gene_type:complete